MATSSTTAEQKGEILWFSPIILPTLEARRWRRPTHTPPTLARTLILDELSGVCWCRNWKEVRRSPCIPSAFLERPVDIISFNTLYQKRYSTPTDNSVLLKGNSGLEDVRCVRRNPNIREVRSLKLCLSSACP